jgi:hypothetical protein
MRASPIFAFSVAVVLASATAVAQTMPNLQMHQGPMMGGGMMSMMGMMDPGQHIEGRLAFLRTELKITEAQTAPWNAYAEALRTNAKRMSEFMSTMMGGGMMGGGMMGQGMMRGPAMTMPGPTGSAMTLPDHFARAEKHQAAHAEMLRTMKAPTLQLYAALADDQKRMADVLLRGPMGMMGMM